MSEMSVVEFAQTITIVDSLSYNYHCCESKVVVLENLGQVFQLATINALLLPC